MTVLDGAKLIAIILSLINVFVFVYSQTTKGKDERDLLTVIREKLRERRVVKDDPDTLWNRPEEQDPWDL